MTFHLFLNVSISGHILDLMAPAMRNNSLAEQVESRRRFGPQNLAEPHKSTPRFLVCFGGAGRQRLGDGKLTSR